MFKSTPSNPHLNQLLEEARKRPPMTLKERQEQRISFAYGNLALHDERVTKEDVRKVAEEIYGRIE